jgi:hypothetical protein
MIPHFTFAIVARLLGRSKAGRLRVEYARLEGHNL